MLTIKKFKKYNFINCFSFSFHDHKELFEYNQVNILIFELHFHPILYLD